MSVLAEHRIRACDSEGLVDDVLAQPHQLGDALWRVESAGIEPRDAPGLCVCGTGASAIGAALAVAALGDRATRPIWIARVGSWVANQDGLLFEIPCDPEGAWW